MTNIYICTVVLNLIIFFNLNYISKFLNIYDFPDKKLKLHKKKIPLIGGPILFLNFLLILIFIYIDKEFNFIFRIEEILSFLLLIFGFFSLGLYDDKFNLNPTKKIIITFLIILISLFLNENLLIKKFSLTFYDSKIFLDNFGFIFTIFCILILTNSFNFYDGINGQSLINFIFIFISLYFLTNFREFYLLFILIFLFVLILNLSGKIFLGDSGIYLISAIICIIFIYEHNLFKTIVYADYIFFLACLPGFDLVRLTITRLINNQNAFYGDRNHLHHLLLKKFSLLTSNLILIFLLIIPVLLFFLYRLSFFNVVIIFTVIYSILVSYLLKK